jgi:Putative prokaryotic signal transducing protein
MLKDWTKVFSTQNGLKAELLKNELLTHEVHAVVMNRQDSNYPIFGNHEVYVPDNQALISKVIVDLFTENNQEPNKI